MYDVFDEWMMHMSYSRKSGRKANGNDDNSPAESAQSRHRFINLSLIHLFFKKNHMPVFNKS
jgi:hypothetical protein